MPYVSVRTNVSVSEKVEEKLVDVLGSGIEVITNKAREGLFIKIEDQCALYKGGRIAEPNAMVSVDLFGYSTAEDLKAYSKVVADILKDELGVEKEQLYINFTECRHWTANGECITAFEV